MIVNLKTNLNKNWRSLKSFKKITVCLLLTVACLILFDVKAAFAHRPHDVIEQIELSSTYEQDKTVFIIVRHNLFKSTDGGASWKRLVKGLDNYGDFSSLKIAPQTKNILFLSSLGDGIYKSQDEGISWFKVNNGLPTLEVERLAISPHSSDVVLAAGKSKGLYKTQDGGKSWSPVLNSDAKVTAIAFSPVTKNQIIIGDNRGVLSVSTDDGKTWKQASTLKNSGSIKAIAISPNFASDNTVFIATEKAGIFQSADSGKSFVAVNQGLSDQRVEDLVISPNYGKDSTLIVSTWDEGAFQSNDGGKTWRKTSTGLTKDHQADEGQFKSPHFTELVVSNSFPQDKTLFLGGFNGLFKSTDAGQTWNELDTLSPRTIVSLDLSPNYQNDSSIAINTYVGEQFISNDNGATWRLINKGLEVPRFTRNFKKPDQDPRRFFDIAFSPNYRSDNTLFSTVLWTYFLRSPDQGRKWDIISLPKVAKRATRGLTIAASPNFASDKTVYVGTQYGVIYRSTDGGKTFKNVGDVGNRQGNEPLSLVLSPDFASNRTLYASGPKGVYQSVDGGVNWQPITTNSDLAQSNNIQIALSPNYKTDRTIFVGTNRGLFQTKDAGKSWIKLAGSAYGGDAYIEGIAISPYYQNDKTLLVSVKGKGLFRSIDGGGNFTSIGDDSITLSKLIGPPSAGIPLKFSPAYATDKTIYGFGSAQGEVFKSTDGGNTWKTIVLPKYPDKIGTLTFLDLAFEFYPILRVIPALIVSLLAYLALGYLKIEKKLPFSKLAIRAGGAFTAFILVWLLLSIFF